MVNVEKHKKKYLSETELQEMELLLINTINNNPNEFINFLDNNKMELERCYTKLNVKASGNVLTSETCQTVLNLVYTSDFTLETLNFYGVHSFKVDNTIIDIIWVKGEKP